MDLEKANVEYLYHYTSVDSLALILKNRTIRLNPLDKMDDLQEKKTSDIKNFGKFFFVSSWTSEEQESIPMWKMYTSQISGVRIKLPKNPFKKNQTSGSDIENAIGAKAIDEDSRKHIQETFLNIAELMKLGVFSTQAWKGDILHEVIYTNDLSLLEPQTLTVTNEGTTISFDKLGRYKNEHWRFQKEWRYLLSFIPMNFMRPVEEMSKDFTRTAVRIINGVEQLPFSNFDLTIDDHCFSEMEITPSPHMSMGYRVLLEDLVEKYNPSAKIIESALKGLI